MCTGAELAMISAATYAVGQQQSQKAASRALGREADAFVQLGRDRSARMKRIGELDEEVAGVVGSLNKLYSRNEGFDARMARLRDQSEQDAIKLIEDNRPTVTSGGEAATLGEQLVNEANVIEAEKADQYVRQQVAAQANLRSLADSLDSLTPDLIGGISEARRIGTTQKGIASLADYDDQTYNVAVQNARNSAVSGTGEFLKQIGQLAAYAAMAKPTGSPGGAGSGITASGGGSGLSASAGTPSFKTSGYSFGPSQYPLNGGY